MATETSPGVPTLRGATGGPNNGGKSACAGTGPGGGNCPLWRLETSGSGGSCPTPDRSTIGEIVLRKLLPAANGVSQSPRAKTWAGAGPTEGSAADPGASEETGTRGDASSLSVPAQGLADNNSQTTALIWTVTRRGILPPPWPGEHPVQPPGYWGMLHPIPFSLSATSYLDFTRIPGKERQEGAVCRVLIGYIPPAKPHILPP